MSPSSNRNTYSSRTLAIKNIFLSSTITNTRALSQAVTNLSMDHYTSTTSSNSFKSTTAAQQLGHCQYHHGDYYPIEDLHQTPASSTDQGVSVVTDVAVVVFNQSINLEEPSIVGLISAQSASSHGFHFQPSHRPESAQRITTSHFVKPARDPDFYKQST
jgi:hypothetical protein